MFKIRFFAKLLALVLVVWMTMPEKALAWIPAEISGRNVTLRQYLPSCDVEGEAKGTILDKNGGVDYSQNIACPVELFPDKKGWEKYEIPHGSKVSYKNTVPPKTLRYQLSFGGSRVSNHQWVDSIIIEEIKNLDGTTYTSLSINPKLRDKLNKMYLVLYKPAVSGDLGSATYHETPVRDRDSDSANQSQKGKSQKDQSQKKPATKSEAAKSLPKGLPVLSGQAFRCYQALEDEMPGQESRDGLRFLLYYYFQVADSKTCTRPVSGKPKKRYRDSDLKDLVRKKIVELQANPSREQNAWTADNLKKYLKWVNSSSYPYVGCRGTGSGLRDDMIAYFDKGQSNGKKRFYLINPKTCSFVKFPSSKLFPQYLRGKDAVTYLGHGGGYKKGSAPFGHRVIKKRGRNSRISEGKVARCSFSKKGRSWYAGNKRVWWARHANQNMSRPGVFVTKGLAWSRNKAPGKRGAWPVLYYRAGKKRRFNFIDWKGLDDRGAKARRTAVVVHARRAAPYFLSWGCPTFKPKTIESLANIGLHRNVFSFVWIPQCDYEKQHEEYARQVRSKFGGGKSINLAEIGLSGDVIKRISDSLSPDLKTRKRVKRKVRYKSKKKRRRWRKSSNRKRRRWRKSSRRKRR